MKRAVVIISAFLSLSMILHGCTKTEGVQDSIPESTAGSLGNSTGITVSSADDSALSEYTDIQELVFSDQISTEFVLTTDYALKDFKIQTVSYDGVNCEIENVLYESDLFKPETALKISAYIPPAFSNMLVSYIDKDGKVTNYFINSDMDSGKGAILAEADEALNQ